MKQRHEWYDRAREVLDKEGPPEVVSEVTGGGPWRGPTLAEWLERIERYVTSRLQGGRR